jgi:hypothetical protein
MIIEDDGARKELRIHTIWLAFLTGAVLAQLVISIVSYRDNVDAEKRNRDAIEALQRPPPWMSH